MFKNLFAKRVDFRAPVKVAYSPSARYRRAAERTVAALSADLRHG
jgi:hypothetical protein